MSENNPIRLFVTHAFEATPDYLRVFEYLEHANKFFYINHADPENIPPGDMKAITDALREQLRPAEAVIALASLAVSAPDLLRFQLDCAGAFDKPIIAMEPFGGIETMPAELARRADAVVAWNEREIVDTIRLQARHEDTERWEVLDFP